jgi:lipopolysaccharide transport system ATP-binding protein
MYVRLAFAVAAHLEPEILIVDEVLAVGDAEFQKKCLGKMKDVSVNQGRTVLFVSHNMATMKNLCDRGLFLSNAKLALDSSIEKSIEEYFLSNNELRDEYSDIIISEKDFEFTSWNVLNSIDGKSIKSGVISDFIFSFIAKKPLEQAELGLVLRDYKGDIIFSCNSRDNGGDYIDIVPGTINFKFNFRLPIKHGSYEVDIAIVSKLEIVEQWISKTKLIVLSDFKSHLSENWIGIVTEAIKFEYAQIP